MAFGFERLPGTSRNYVYRSGDDFPTGTVLSRKQYDRYVERLGKRTHLAGFDQLRETERKLEALKADLAAREAGLNERERLVAARERDLLEAQRAIESKQYTRLQHQRARQRRANLMLDMFVDKQRAAGKKISKRDAKSLPEYKEIMATIRKTDKPSKNPNVRAKQTIERLAAFRAVGGADQFREKYERAFGRPKRAARPANNARRANKG